MKRVPSDVTSSAPHGLADTWPPPPPPPRSPSSLLPPPPPKAYRIRATGITVRLPATTGSPYTFFTDALAETRSAMPCKSCWMFIISVEHVVADDGNH